MEDLEGVVVVQTEAAPLAVEAPDLWPVVEARDFASGQ